MNEIKVSKKILRRIISVFLSLILLLLVVWLGFSFFSMKNDKPYVSMAINLEGNSLAEKVVRDFPIKDGKYLSYEFPVILEEYTETNGGYEIVGVPYNYKSYYSTRDESRFTYVLPKNQGEFDFSKLEWNEPLVISLRYRVDHDLRYFINFSLCTFKRFYSDLFNIGDSCSRANCIIGRDLNAWSIGLVDKDIIGKEEYFNKYDRDSLIRGLFNFFITDDFGYYNEKQFKLKSTQRAAANGTYQFFSDFVNNKVDPTNSSTVGWIKNGISQIYKKSYAEYDEIDLISYSQTVDSYTSDEVSQVFFDCQIAYQTISNLKGCGTEKCNSIKTRAYEDCAKAINFEISRYPTLATNYEGDDSSGIGNGFVIYLPSELIYFNRIVKELNIEKALYTKETILSYFNSAENFETAYPAVISKCYLLKDSEEIYSEYGNELYLNKANSLFTSLPDFVSICDNIVKDDFCSLSLAQKMVCADATMNNHKDISRAILYDIFYRNYFDSSISPKIASYKEYRLFGRNSLNTNKGEKVLDEYGYFVTREEKNEEGEITVLSSSNMIDSYYFIYLLDKLNNE